MIKLQKIEVLSNDNVKRLHQSAFFLEKESFVSIEENKSLSRLSESFGYSHVVSRIVYSAAGSHQEVNVVGSPDSIFKLFEHGTQKGPARKTLLHG